MRKLWGSEPRTSVMQQSDHRHRLILNTPAAQGQRGTEFPKPSFLDAHSLALRVWNSLGYEWHGFLLCDLGHVSQPFWVPGVSRVQWEQQQHSTWGSFSSSDERKKPESTLKRVARGKAARSFLGQGIPLQTAPPAVWEDIRAPKRGRVHRPWAQPASQENPRAFQPWEGDILHLAVSMEKIPVPAILQPIWPNLCFIIFGNFVIWVGEWVVYRATVLKSLILSHLHSPA